jgi:glycosyltransferase involved in cell wall biosynthesis
LRSSQDPAISIVIPFYNEAENVAAVLREVERVMDDHGEAYELIAVEDGSTDGTLLLLLALQKNMESLRVIRMRRNAGQTAAVQAGFDACRGEIVVSMDGDGQNDPSAIPMVVAKVREGFDLVCGWRYERQDRLVTRKIPSWIANWAIGILTGVRIHDNGCSLKGYTSSLIRRMKLYSDQHRFIPALASLVGARIAEVKVPHRARLAGTSKYGLSRTYKVLLDVVSLVMLRQALPRPALAFAGPGLAFAFLGACLIVATVVAAWRQNEAIIVVGGSGFLLLFLGGHFLVLSFIAELVRASSRPARGPWGVRQ